MKLEAKQRLLADDAAFAQALANNLNSMTPAQLRSLMKALDGVQAWFNGDAMSKTDLSKVEIKATPLNLNLVANGMAWLSRVFGLGKPPSNVLYRMHDMLYPYAKAVGKNPNKLVKVQFDYRDPDSDKQIATKIRQHFPIGSTLVVPTNKALVSFSTSMDSVKKLGKQVRDNGTYYTDAYLQIPVATVRVLIVAEKVPGSVKKAAALLKVKGLTSGAESAAYSIRDTMWKISHFASQREVVCLVNDHKFKAQILDYANETRS